MDIIPEAQDVKTLRDILVKLNRKQLFYVSGMVDAFMMANEIYAESEGDPDALP